ncbi:hypothetical protein [Actinomadura parmotrematis]|uniref:Uncharacterized protein n=1 Tax=Actinomadura parmotrematis TaxID=2864039 RepID=A0ABS7FWT8_9ACTN|nr:hypothetical protein [Actinomadura parmotrematis]MBW8484736.1 hypothetical protein [Actinomadura parmotrematis]
MRPDTTPRGALALPGRHRSPAPARPGSVLPGFVARALVVAALALVGWAVGSALSAPASSAAEGAPHGASAAEPEASPDAGCAGPLCAGLRRQVAAGPGALAPAAPVVSALRDGEGRVARTVRAGRALPRPERTVRALAGAGGPVLEELRGTGGKALERVDRGVAATIPARIPARIPASIPAPRSGPAGRLLAPAQAGDALAASLDAAAPSPARPGRAAPAAGASRAEPEHAALTAGEIEADGPSARPAGHATARAAAGHPAAPAHLAGGDVRVEHRGAPLPGGAPQGPAGVYGHEGVLPLTGAGAGHGLGPVLGTAPPVRHPAAAPAGRPGFRAEVLRDRLRAITLLVVPD